MKDEEILQKAFFKAHINGWDFPVPDDVFAKRILWKDRYFQLIFSHEFAKAFWGNTIITPLSVTFKNNEIKNNEVVTIAGTIWQYHLQQMVLQKEPVKYLEKFL